MLSFDCLAIAAANPAVDDLDAIPAVRAARVVNVDDCARLTVAAIAALVLGSWRMLQLASVRYCLSIMPRCG